MANEFDIQEIKQKSAHGILFLSLRNLGIQAISFVGFFLLTLLLGTSEVGVFALVAETVGVLAYFSDIGLASALIQQKEPVDLHELRTTFTIQQILVSLSLLVVFLLYPQISFSRHFGGPETLIVISLCFSFFISSLKTIPSVLLERKLNFVSLSTVDIVENTIFYVISVIFAYFGFGLYSYAFAIFIRSLIGLLLIYHLSPWSIGYGFSLPAIKKLFRFGIPFQLNSFIALAKDRLSSLMVAGIIGTQGFGFLSWAQKWSRLSLGLMDSVMRVTFPAFSRLQHDPVYLKKSIEKSLFFIALFVFPTLAGASAIAKDFIFIFPKYTKWLPALIPLYLYCLNTAIAAITTPLTNAFNAIGKITTTTRLMIMWTILTWILFPLFSYQFGYIGTAAATLAVGLSSFVAWYLAYRQFNINIPLLIIHPLIASLIMFIILLTISTLTLNPALMLITKIIFGIIVYLIYLRLFTHSQLSWFIVQLKWLRHKK